MALAHSAGQRTDLSALVGVPFRNQELLDQAFVHKSYLNENPEYAGGCNERMEFLGDAFLGFVVANELFTALPEATEGDLTKRRSALVQRDTLAAIVRERGWGTALVMGQGEEERGGRERLSTLANLYEAIVGAVLLDQGETATRAFVLMTLEEVQRDLEAGTLAVDYKSLLQEYCQAKRWDSPQYVTISESGPPHARRYEAEALVLGQSLGAGEGSSKIQDGANVARSNLRPRQNSRSEFSPAP